VSEIRPSAKRKTLGNVAVSSSERWRKEKKWREIEEEEIRLSSILFCIRHC
jgi:hypothetical protein